MQTHWNYSFSFVTCTCICILMLSAQRLFCIKLTHLFYFSFWYTYSSMLSICGLSMSKEGQRRKGNMCYPTFPFPSVTTSFIACLSYICSKSFWTPTHWIQWKSACMGHQVGFKQTGWWGTVPRLTARSFSAHVHALLSHQTLLTNTSSQIKRVKIQGAQEGINPNIGHFWGQRLMWPAQVICPWSQPCLVPSFTFTQQLNHQYWPGIATSIKGRWINFAVPG